VTIESCAGGVGFIAPQSEPGKPLVAVGYEPRLGFLRVLG
jgi:hypothetical protein